MTGSGLEKKMVDAWTTVENPPIDAVNPHYKTRYATLRSTLEVVRAACRSMGIAYMQRMEREPDGRFVMTSWVTDGSAELKLSTFPVAEPGDPQKFGSALTYTKRQQAQADWGIVGEEDDDAEATAGERMMPHQRRQGAADMAADLEAARNDFSNALRRYCERHGVDLDSARRSEVSQPGYADEAGWYRGRARFLDSQ